MSERGREGGRMTSIYCIEGFFSGRLDFHGQKMTMYGAIYNY